MKVAQFGDADAAATGGTWRRCRADAENVVRIRKPGSAVQHAGSSAAGRQVAQSSILVRRKRNESEQRRSSGRSGRHSVGFFVDRFRIGTVPSDGFASAIRRRRKQLLQTAAFISTQSAGIVRTGQRLVVHRVAAGSGRGSHADVDQFSRLPLTGTAHFALPFRPVGPADEPPRIRPQFVQSALSDGSVTGTSFRQVTSPTGGR